MKRIRFSMIAALAACAVMVGQPGAAALGAEVVAEDGSSELETAAGVENVMEAELQEEEIVILEDTSGDGDSGEENGSLQGEAGGEDEETQSAPQEEQADGDEKLVVEEIEAMEPAGTETETENAIAAGYQFAEGYGICGPENPVVYMAVPGEKAVYENEDFSLSLTGGLYQQGELRLILLLKDYTVELLDEEETARYLEQERINQEKQEKGEAADWDWSYFCMDEEQQIYAHSSLREKWLDNLNFRLCRAGSQEYGYYSKSTDSSASNSYEEYRQKGYLSIQIGLGMEKKTDYDWSSGEVYTLLSEEAGVSLDVAFECAQEVESLDEIPGILRTGDIYTLLRTGKMEDGITQVSGYLYSVGEDTAEGCDMEMLGADGEILEPVPYGGAGIGVGYAATYFEGFLPGAWFSGYYRLPEEGGSKVALTPYLRSEIQTTELLIPVVEKSSPLDISLTLRDCAIRLTGVEPGEDQTVAWDGKGEPIKARTILVTGAVTSTGEDREIWYISGEKSGMQPGQSSRPYLNRIYGDVKEDGTLRLPITWEEGEQNVAFTLDRLAYRQKEKIELPVG